jgi:hypothetical protein
MPRSLEKLALRLGTRAAGLLLGLSVGCSDGGSSAAPTAGPGAASVAVAPASASVAATASAPTTASAPASASAAPDEAPRAAGIMYELEIGGAKSWILGTMHIGVDAEKALPKVVFERLDAADVVVFEANVFDVDTMAVLQKAMLPEGKSAKAGLKPENWNRLVERLGGFLTPESALERYRPWFLLTLLTADILPKTDPMDKVLYERADAAKKRVEYLETVDEQLVMIDKAIDDAMLDDMLGDMKKAEDQIRTLADAYRAGDADGLARVTFDPEDMKKHPAMFDEMLFARNARWMSKLEPLGKKGGMFIAVGAAHLLGEKGVVARFERAGFKATRVGGAGAPAPAP